LKYRRSREPFSVIFGEGLNKRRRFIEHPDSDSRSG
jgi:hypothetical protein